MSREIKIMTAKKAIKIRCADCLAGIKVCPHDDCPIKGLSKPVKGARRGIAIKEYCKWCLNGHNFSLCNSADCAINQYRKSA